jgi:hypothetical protein
MAKAEEIEYLAIPYAKKYFIAGISFLLISVFEIIIDKGELAIYFEFFFIFFSVYFIYLKIKIFKTSAMQLPIWLSLFGIVYIIGGKILDIAAQINSSDSFYLFPSYDYNYFQMFLNGYSNGFIYGLVITKDILLVTTLCLSWVTFLRHRKTIIELSEQSFSTNLIGFIKSVLFGTVILHNTGDSKAKIVRNFAWYRCVMWLLVAPLVLPFFDSLDIVVRLFAKTPNNLFNGFTISLLFASFIFPYLVWLWIESKKRLLILDSRQKR